MFIILVYTRRSSLWPETDRDLNQVLILFGMSRVPYQLLWNPQGSWVSAFGMPRVSLYEGWSKFSSPENNHLACIKSFLAKNLRKLANAWICWYGGNGSLTWEQLAKCWLYCKTDLRVKRVFLRKTCENLRGDLPKALKWHFWLNLKVRTFRSTLIYSPLLMIPQNPRSQVPKSHFSYFP